MGSLTEMFGLMSAPPVKLQGFVKTLSYIEKNDAIMAFRNKHKLYKDETKPIKKRQKTSKENK